MPVPARPCQRISWPPCAGLEAVHQALELLARRGRVVLADVLPRRHRDRAPRRHRAVRPVRPEGDGDVVGRGAGRAPGAPRAGARTPRRRRSSSSRGRGRPGVAAAERHLHERAVELEQLHLVALGRDAQLRRGQALELARRGRPAVHPRAPEAALDEARQEDAGDGGRRLVHLDAEADRRPRRGSVRQGPSVEGVGPSGSLEYASGAAGWMPCLRARRRRRRRPAASRTCSSSAASTFPTCWFTIGWSTRWPIEPTGPAIETSASQAIFVVLAVARRG